MCAHLPILTLMNQDGSAMARKVTGPFDLPTLQRQVKQGQLSRLHQVSTDQANWKQAADVPGLYWPAVV